MALHVALNRTPKEETEENFVCDCEPCECVEEEDFTASDMAYIQEQKENCCCNLKQVRAKINQILYDCAGIAGMRSIRVVFCSKLIAADNNDFKSVVVKDFDKNDLEEIAAWLRNNGFYTDYQWNREPHGNVMGSILIYWR